MIENSNFRSRSVKKSMCNVSIVLGIFLTLPVTVASGERSFSKMAQVKNKFIYSTKQDRLVSLSMLAIEHKMALENH